MVEAAVPASYADVEIKERLDTFRKKKGANVAKTVMARWLLKVGYHVLKQRRPYITSYNKPVKERSTRLWLKHVYGSRRIAWLRDYPGKFEWSGGHMSTLMGVEWHRNKEQ